MGVMKPEEVESLYRRMLLELWHAPEAELAAPDMIIHQRGESRRGAQQLVALVHDGRAPFTGVHVSLLQGPLVGGEHVAARWRFEAR